MSGIFCFIIFYIYIHVRYFFILLSFIFIFMLFGKPPAIWLKVYWAVHFLQNTNVVGLGIVIKGSFVQIIAGPSKKKLGLLVVSWFDLNVSIFYVIFEIEFSKWSLVFWSSSGKLLGSLQVLSIQSRPIIWLLSCSKNVKRTGLRNIKYFLFLYLSNWCCKEAETGLHKNLLLMLRILYQRQSKMGLQQIMQIFGWYQRRLRHLLYK